FLIVGFLVYAALTIAHHSIQNINKPHALPQPYTLLVLGAIILWKEASYRWVIKKSKEVNSTTLRADAWHHRSDAMTSLAAFIGITIALVMGKGYESADDWAALLASGFILYNSYLIFRPALGEVMDEHVHQDIEVNIRDLAQKVRGVMATEKCHIRKTGMVLHVDLHIVVNGNITVKEGHDIAHELKDQLKAAIPELADVLIHVEPYEGGQSLE
ncbi:MAG TPA: cation diffusion facilitator family transporter, partial [Cytophagales bacterium]|nr:cation diffusion facilitator family transporter [Cytophagales bacterium]